MRLFKWLVFFAALFFLGLPVKRTIANPLGGAIENGQATILQPDANTTLVDQQSDRAVAGFDSFNLGTNDQFVVRQPGSHAILWVKDYQSGPSQIHGSIAANGQVWVSNPNGIMVGPSGKIDTAGTLLTSSSMRNQDFVAGNYDFSQAGRENAAVINEGLISARDAGLVGLVAPGVVNDGIIRARLGRVGLASGNRFTVDVRGDGLFRFAPDDEVLGQVIDHRTGLPLKHLVSNNGLIEAPGGLVALSAVNTRLLLDSVIDNSGRILAPTFEKKVGKVTFSTALPSQQRAQQTVQQPRQKITVSGTVDVSGRGENQTGGEIRILGEVLGLKSANLDASGDVGGGLVLVGGTYFGNKLSISQRQALGIKNPEEVIQAAQETVVLNTTITADALTAGNGGQVVVRAEDRAAIQGTISTRGEHGVVDTSGLNQLALEVDIDVSDPLGDKAGHWGIDPGNIIVAETAPTIDFSNPFAAATATTIAASDIETTLNAGGDVSILTDGGRIDVNTDIQKSSGDESTLRFDATSGFRLASGTKIERVTTGDFDVNKHDLNVVINGNTDRDGTGTTQIDGQIISLGGDVTVKGQRIVLQTGAIQTLNDPEGQDGTVFVEARVTDGPNNRGIIDLGPQAINAGSAAVTVEATGTATDDTVSFGGERAISTTGKVTVFSDRIEANPSRTPHIFIGQSSPTPSITGTQLQSVVIATSNSYQPLSPPVGPVDDAPTVGAGTLLNHTRNTGDQFDYTTPANTFADDGGAANLTLTASGLPSGITFQDNQNGTISFTGQPTSTGTFTVTITASDGTTGNNPVSRTFRIVVEAGTTPPPTPTNQVPVATTAGIVTQLQAGTSFNFTTPAGTFTDDGGVQNLTLTVVNLPAGLNQPVLNADGSVTFTGTPTSTGTFRPTLRVQDASGAFVEKNVRFEVQTGTVTPPPVSANTQPTVSSAPIQLGWRTDQTFTVTTAAGIVADDGGVQNLTLTAQNLPTGVAQPVLNTNGSVSFNGRPSTPGTFIITLVFRDAQGAETTKQITFSVEGPTTTPTPPTTTDNPPTASSLPTFTQTASVFGDVSLAVSRDFFADDNGTVNLALSLRDGFSPPDGTQTSISPDGTFVVSGTLRRPGTFIIPVEATDNNGSGQSVTRTFTIVFNPANDTTVETQTEQSQQQTNEEEIIAPVAPEVDRQPSSSGPTVQDALAVDPNARVDVSDQGSSDQTRFAQPEAPATGNDQTSANDANPTPNAPQTILGPRIDQGPSVPSEFDLSGRTSDLAEQLLVDNGFNPQSLNFEDSRDLLQQQLVEDLSNIGYSAWVAKHKTNLAKVYSASIESFDEATAKQLMFEAFKEAVVGAPANALGVATALIEEGAANAALILPSTWIELRRQSEIAFKAVTDLAAKYNVDVSEVFAAMADGLTEAPSAELADFNQLSPFEQGKAMGFAMLVLAPTPGGKVTKAQTAVQGSVAKVLDVERKLESGDLKVSGDKIVDGNPGASSVGGAGNATNSLPNPPSLTISNSQWGTKSAQHMQDFDLDVRNPAHRQQFRDMVENIGSNPDRVVEGTFSGGGPTGRRDVLFYVQGNDVVVTSPAGEFVTVLRNGVTNPNVVRSLDQ